ncbi:NTE family protein [Prauserella shujinwangii]|uniref:NTE family protein n=1 Tax=Prauserella shujinwangii TaxID=1453103 RepID=A0A2T0LSD9_9PSEU|nr:patatin-like phospholipase family protein [Prauserella shujinwangii]PRX46576.1 NTE family protein [Prauserella shujinwangii]
MAESTGNPATAGKTGFVLSGGGSLGAIQAGMVRALYERDIAPDLIVGTSVGALNSAFLASRPPAVPTARTLADVWTSLRHRDVFPLSPLTALLGLLGFRDHLVSPRGLKKLLRRWVEFDRLEQAPVPLHLIATEVLTGDERRLSSGPAAEAARASAALPGVFPPVRIGGDPLMDGGVTNNTPISQALAHGATRIYVLPTGYPCALREPPGSALAVAAHALSLLIQRRLVEDIRRIPDGFPLIVLPPPCPLTVAPTDFSRSAELVERGLANARDFLDDLPPGLPAVPETLREPSHQHARP